MLARFGILPALRQQGRLDWHGPHPSQSIGALGMAESGVEAGGAWRFRPQDVAITIRIAAKDPSDGGFHPRRPIAGGAWRLPPVHSPPGGSYSKSFHFIARRKGSIRSTTSPSWKIRTVPLVSLTATATLLVADLHLGKAATFRSQGIPVPEGSAQKDLARLALLVAATRARRLIVLGDLFHAKSGCTEHVFAEFTAARERFGGVDVLVNNAGLGHAGPLAKGEVEQWREMLEVNVLGLCICTREALADMRARGGRGQIIHIGSMAGQRVPAGAGLYAATKHAVRALTESLRMELREAGDPIRVGEICPGFVETGFAAHYLKSDVKARETYSQFKVLEAGDVAEAVVYMLACPDHVQVHDILMRPTVQPT